MQSFTSIGLITKIGPVSQGDKPRGGPDHSIPLRVEVQTTTGQGLLELSRSAAAELAEEIQLYLQKHGSR